MHRLVVENLRSFDDKSDALTTLPNYPISSSGSTDDGGQGIQDTEANLVKLLTKRSFLQISARPVKWLIR